MSAPRMRLELAARAKSDISSIRAYGRAQWGEAQADRYSAALGRAFELLQDNPEMGVARDDLAPGMRTWPVEHHRIFYRIRGNAIRVLRVTHERQDENRLFDR